MKMPGSKFSIEYHPLVISEDIPKLSKIWQKRIKESIETKLSTRPEIFGQPLRQNLKGYRKLRVGDYRIIFKVNGRNIYILLIEHRSVVYREIQRRN
ncbi:MAG: type II toxin-antitoxin system RelE/ParE family toxin [Candidatus Spechtbacterales bacterium]